MKILKCLMMTIVGVCFTTSFVLPVWALSPQPDPPGTITLPKGTTAEKLGAGHFKFKLPDGRVVEVKGLKRSGGAAFVIGDCGIYDPTGKLIASGKQGSLKSGPKPAAGKIDKDFLKIDTGFLKIDNEPSWFPITIQFQKTGTQKKI